MARKRITITLKNELLKQLDDLVDGRLIRNRSHAIEEVLSGALAKKPIKALILAGGKGVAFSSLVSETPKALLLLDGKPLLEHTLLKLKSASITEVVISVGQHGQKIKDYFRNGSRWDMKISYLDQQPGKKGTAHPVKQAQAEFLNTFLLLYGDVLADIDYNDLLDYHRSQTGLVSTMALTSVERVSMWGVARLVGSRIIQFEEKPKNPKTRSHLVNAGVYVAEPALFKFIQPEDSMLESGAMPRLAEEGKLGGYSFDGKWFDVSTAQAYQEVLKQL